MKPCPICGSAADPCYRANDENRRCSAEEFAYGECTRCGTIFLSNVPNDLGRYYEADYYEIPSVERLQRIADASRNKIELVNRFAAGKRLAEIGSAFGVFVLQAKQAGYDVDAIEMDARCCAYLRDQVGVRAVQSDTPHEALRTLPEHDVVALWHVLEHLRDPAAVIEAAAENLAPGGVLVIATPNPEAAQFGLMGHHWPHLDAPRHLALMPISALAELGSRHGLHAEFVTTDDPDARHWNRFGWQWLLRNRVRSKTAKRAMFVAGTILALAMSPFDRRAGRGSAYTMVLRKPA
jgi:SAM-dependent methyltransferase